MTKRLLIRFVTPIILVARRLLVRCSLTVCYSPLLLLAHSFNTFEATGHQSPEDIAFDFGESTTAKNAANAKSVRTWSSSAYAFLRPGSLNIGSRTAAANAPPTIRASSATVNNSICWINFGWYH